MKKQLVDESTKRLLNTTIAEIKSLNEKFSKNSTIISHALKLATLFNEANNDYEIVVNADTDSALDTSAAWFSLSVFKNSSLIKTEKVYY